MEGKLDSTAVTGGTEHGAVPLKPSTGVLIQGGRVLDPSQNLDATARARSYFSGYGPSSPSIGILKDGQLVYMMERFQIEGRGPDEIATELKRAFNEYCGSRAAGAN